MCRLMRQAARKSNEAHHASPKAVGRAPRAHNVPSARGAKPEAPHGPFQRLLDGDAPAIVCLHSSRNATQVPAPTSAQTIHGGTLRMPASESRNTVPPISRSGAVIPQ